MSGNMTVVVVDDHGLVRGSLARYLHTVQDVEVVAEANNADDALEAVAQHQPDIVITDIDMPGRGVFDAARMMKVRSPNTKIIFLSAFAHDRYISDALAVKASAYLTKSEPPETLLRAIRVVASGRSFFSAEIQSRIVIDADGVHLKDVPTTRISTLTPRELEVLEYLARGMSKKEIAGTMHLSVKTIENHSTNLMSKLDIHDRVELARFAIREGLVRA